eukprot:6204427-Pleurochrysis_carterae.AAC.1
MEHGPDARKTGPLTPPDVRGAHDSAGAAYRSRSLTPFSDESKHSAASVACNQLLTGEGASKKA